MYTTQAVPLKSCHFSKTTCDLEKVNIVVCKKGESVLKMLYTTGFYESYTLMTFTFMSRSPKC